MDDDVINTRFKKLLIALERDGNKIEDNEFLKFLATDVGPRDWLMFWCDLNKEDADRVAYALDPVLVQRFCVEARAFMLEQLLSRKMKLRSPEYFARIDAMIEPLKACTGIAVAINEIFANGESPA
jgi:hypothetical protein